VYANKKLYTELVVPFPPLPEIPPVLNNKQKTLKKIKKNITKKEQRGQYCQLRLLLQKKYNYPDGLKWTNFGTHNTTEEEDNLGRVV